MLTNAVEVKQLEMSLSPSTLVAPERHGLPAWVDTHCHLVMTYSACVAAGYSFDSVFDMAHQLFPRRQVAFVVDIWCDAPILMDQCRHLADADETEDWHGLSYRFAIGL